MCKRWNPVLCNTVSTAKHWKLTKNVTIEHFTDTFVYMTDDQARVWIWEGEKQECFEKISHEKEDIIHISMLPEYPNWESMHVKIFTTPRTDFSLFLLQYRGTVSINRVKG